MSRASPSVRISRIITPGQIKKIYVPHSVLEDTACWLRKYGTKRSEGLVFWAGIETDGPTIITTCVYPRISESSAGHVRVEAKNGARMVSEVRKMGLQVLAEVHSHPFPGTGHSWTDNSFPFAFYKGYLSIVVGDFGEDGMEPLTRCGVHRYENGRFRRLSNSEIQELFQVVDDELNLHEDR